MITLRFGFPTQPGHWLLLHVATIPLVTAAAWQLQLSREYDSQAVAVALGMLALAAASAGSMPAKPLRWQMPFVMASAGLIVLALQFWHLEQQGPAGDYGVDYVFANAAKTMVLGALIGLASAITVDLYSRARYDPLHWIGVCTLAAALLHGALLMLLEQWV